MADNMQISMLYWKTVKANNSTQNIECGQAPPKRKALTVGLGNTLQLILLLDGIGVGGALGGVDELISEALSNGLDVAESRLTGLYNTMMEMSSLVTVRGETSYSGL